MRLPSTEVPSTVRAKRAGEQYPTYGHFTPTLRRPGSESGSIGTRHVFIGGVTSDSRDIHAVSLTFNFRSNDIIGHQFVKLD